LVKKLTVAIYCDDCKIEAEITEKGIMCPKCGAYISDEQLEDESF